MMTHTSRSKAASKDGYFGEFGRAFEVGARPLPANHLHISPAHPCICPIYACLLLPPLSMCVCVFLCVRLSVRLVSLFSLQCLLCLLCLSLRLSSCLLACQFPASVAVSFVLSVAVCGCLWLCVAVCVSLSVSVSLSISYCFPAPCIF